MGIDIDIQELIAPTASVKAHQNFQPFETFCVDFGAFLIWVCVPDLTGLVVRTFVATLKFENTWNFLFADLAPALAGFTRPLFSLSSLASAASSLHPLLLDFAPSFEEIWP